MQRTERIVRSGIGVAPFVPLVVLPLIIHLRMFPFAAPNEDPKLAVLFASSFVIAWTCLAGFLQKRRASIVLSAQTAILVGSLVWLGIGVVFTANRVDGTVRLACWASAALVLLAAARGRRKQEWMDCFHWSSTASALLFVAIFCRDYLFRFGTPGHQPWVLFSPVGHVNFTSDVLVIWLPLLFWSAIRPEAGSMQRSLAWLAAVGQGVILLIAASRAALAALLLAGGLVLALALVRLLRRQPVSVGWREFSLLLCLLVSLLIYGLLPFQFRPVQRLAETLSGTSAQGWVLAVTQPGGPDPPLLVLWQQPWLAARLGPRLPIFASSAAMVLDAPFTGHGTGSFRTVYPAYATRFPAFRDPQSSASNFLSDPHNGLLHVAAENGLPAVLALLALVTGLLIRLLRALIKKPDPELVAGLAAVTGGLTCSMVSHTLANPASLFLFSLVCGMLWGRVAPGKESLLRLPAWTGSLRIPLAMAAAAVSVILLAGSTGWLISQWHLGAAAAQPPASALAKSHYETAHHWNPRCDRALIGLALFALESGQPEKALAELELMQRFHPNSISAHSIAARAHMFSGSFEQAEHELREVLRLRPGDRQTMQLLDRLERGGFQPQNPPDGVSSTSAFPSPDGED